MIQSNIRFEQLEEKNYNIVQEILKQDVYH